MASLERFDVVRVRLPSTDQLAEKNRAVVVISDGAAFNRTAGHSVMAMIPSAAHVPWLLEVANGNLESTELPAPPIVPRKPFSLDHRLLRGTLGRLGAEDRERKRGAMRELMS